MTIAVCLECGRLKSGAWSACPNCGYQPEGDEQLAQSLIVSDNCIARGMLEAMAERRRQGEPWYFDSQLVEAFKERVAALIPKDGQGPPTGMTDG